MGGLSEQVSSKASNCINNDNVLWSSDFLLSFKFYFDWSIIGFIYVFLTLVHHVALGAESRIKIRPTSSTPRIIGTVSPVLANLWAAGRVPREQENEGRGWSWMAVALRKGLDS